MIMPTGTESGSAPAMKDFRSDLKPIWCPGCGDYGVLTALYRALAAIGRPPHEIAFVSGIGCSSRIPGYTTAYGFNTVHGRALPIAQGIKLANPDLTYLVMDNQVYGLTKGQVSPTSARGTKTPTSVYGSMEAPVNPLLYALAYGAGFVAQGVPADMDGLTKMIEAAIRYPGFAFVNIQSPCVSFGDPDNQLKVQKTKLRKLEAEGHDPTNRLRAMELAQEYGQTLYCGIFYQNPQPPPTYDRQIRALQDALQPKPPVETGE